MSEQLDELNWLVEYQLNAPLEQKTIFKMHILIDMRFILEGFKIHL